MTAALPRHTGRVHVLRQSRRGAVRRQGHQPAPARAQLLRPRRPAAHRPDAARDAAGAATSNCPTRCRPRSSRRASSPACSPATTAPAPAPTSTATSASTCDGTWPRLAVVKEPSPTGLHLGPLPSRADGGPRGRGAAVGAAAASLLDAARSQRTSAPPTPRRAVPLNSGSASARAPARPTGRRTTSRSPLRSGRCRATPTSVTTPLSARMSELAAAQRFEEAALVRDRLAALLNAVRRTQLVDAAPGHRALRPTAWRHHLGHRSGPPRRRRPTQAPSAVRCRSIRPNHQRPAAR